MALAVGTRPVARFHPLEPPSDGPWDLPAMQTLEDTAAEWAFGPAEQFVNARWDWVEQYWGGTTLPTAPALSWEGHSWALALLLVLGPRLVTAHVPVDQVIPWAASQPADHLPRQGPDGTHWPRPMRESIAPTVQDVAARVEAWAQDVQDTLTTVITGAKRAARTLDETRQGIAEHFTGWGQDLGRLVQTELSAARADAILETATEAWAIVQTQPTACKTCHAAFDGKIFHILSHAPEKPEAHAQDSLWPGKWTQNWGKKTAEQWPAVPQHPYCKCRVIPVKEKP